jgi:nucleoside 2-deoxyribosyltransferase
LEDENPRISKIVTTIYFAAPLFTMAEWTWNTELAERLERLGFTVILPQNSSAGARREDGTYHPERLFRIATCSMDQADVILAILDGPDVDSGTAWECGYGYAKGKPVIGVRTDLRAGGDDTAAAVNLMLSQCAEQIVRADPFASLDTLADRISSAVILAYAG